MEARVGFEPTNGGFADLSLRPLGYRAEAPKYSENPFHLSVARRSESIVYRFICGTRIASRMKRADSSGGVGQL